MNLQIGIVGLPNVGKSTLFNGLTKNSVPAENYPFCTINPAIGTVEVKDSRLAKLAEFSKSKKIIPAAVQFVDIAGLVKGASQGEGMGNEFLTHIRETDAIAQVVRIFEDEKLIHVENKIDPLHDIEIINTELMLADLSTLEKRKNSLMSEIKKGNLEAGIFVNAIEKIILAFNQNKLANTVILTEEEKNKIQELHLITMKPILFVLNKKSGSQNLDTIIHDNNESNDIKYDERYSKLLNFFQVNNFNYCLVDAKIEDELKDFSGIEKEIMLQEIFGLELKSQNYNGIENLIQEGYKMLGLETFFTTGEDETRAWTIQKNSSAPVAGSAIHNDFKNKFIRAEVIFWENLLNSGSYANARSKGLLRLEGKEYIVQDGDVIEFKI